MIPQNEMGVIVLFAQKAIDKVEIVSIGSSFPDALIEYEGKQYRVEFEFTSLNFLYHGHDPRQCDLVICWKHDSLSLDLVLPVWELSKEDWLTIPVLPTESQREAAYWKQRALAAEKSLEVANSKLVFAQDSNIENIMNLPKRQRILALRTRHPDLPASSIATLAESSPSYVSEVLNGKTDAIITETSPSFVSEVRSEVSTNGNH